MAEKRYILIDKKVVQLDATFDFDIYYPQGEEMTLLLEKESVVEQHHLVASYNQKALYISQKDQSSYKIFHEKYLQSLKDSFELFEDKTATIYSNATDIMNTLFENPDTLGNYEETKEVVNDLVHTILDDHFAIKSLMKIATHDYYTHTHSLNVTVYSLSLGAFIGLSDADLSRLGESALLHDLGKSKVPSEIINKNGRLTPEEFEIMKAHPDLGYEIAQNMGIKDKHILAGIRYHQEKMSGEGYPLGLKGTKIPLFARIIGLCDVFDAITSKRSYKEAMSTFDALSLIKNKMHEHVDNELLAKMIQMFHK